MEIYGWSEPSDSTRSEFAKWPRFPSICSNPMTRNHLRPIRQMAGTTYLMLLIKSYFKRLVCRSDFHARKPYQTKPRKPHIIAELLSATRFYTDYSIIFTGDG